MHTSSKVEIPGLDVLSYAGYITVDEEYDRNLFFWFFPSTEVCFLVFIWYGIERYFFCRQNYMSSNKKKCGILHHDIRVADRIPHLLRQGVKPQRICVHSSSSTFSSLFEE